MFIVVEDRGCGIKYTVAQGTLEEVSKWMRVNTQEHPLSDEIAVHKEMYCNGNGELFTYHIEEEEIPE